MKVVRRPSEIEKKFLKELQGNIKKCPFCGKNLGMSVFIKRKTMGFCKCKKCGKGIFDVPIVY